MGKVVPGNPWVIHVRAEMDYLRTSLGEWEAKSY